MKFIFTCYNCILINNSLTKRIVISLTNKMFKYKILSSEIISVHLVETGTLL
jgi:hypothetical protein